MLFILLLLLVFLTFDVDGCLSKVVVLHLEDIIRLVVPILKVVLVDCNLVDSQLLSELFFALPHIEALIEEGI